jgi:mannose-6-phosphate isomerase-like protein (cupin superfamily)
MSPRHAGGGHVQRQPIDLVGALSRIDELWSPRIVAELNGCHFKVAKFQGEFVWHTHIHTDEAFFVLSGSMTVHFADGDVVVRAGQLFVVPKGVEHKTSAAEECQALLVEAAGTVNTGDVISERTRNSDVWI